MYIKVVHYYLYNLLNTISLKSVFSKLSVPFSNISPIGNSKLTVALNDISLSNSIVISNEILNFISWFVLFIFLINVPSCISSSSFEIYFSFKLLEILNRIRPPWFAISKFFEFVLLAPL